MGTAASEEAGSSSAAAPNPRVNMGPNTCPAHPTNNVQPAQLPPKALDKNANEGALPGHGPGVGPQVNGNRALGPMGQLHNGQLHNQQFAAKMRQAAQQQEDGENDYEEADWKDNLDTDSAFSDTLSLPSSGSHISVTTTSSGSSGGSSGIGSSHASVKSLIKSLINYKSQSKKTPSSL